MPFNVNQLPPDGWTYTEATINWSVPNPMLPFNMVVDQIRKARANNPGSGLGTSYGVVAEALMTTTANRVQDPRWTVGPLTVETLVIKKRRCATCRKK